MLTSSRNVVYGGLKWPEGLYLYFMTRSLIKASKVTSDEANELEGLEASHVIWWLLGT